MHVPISLSALKQGDVAHVCEVVGPIERTRRLKELGFRAGARLEVLQAGSPCIVRIDGSKLCFRDGELASVLVQPRMSA